MSCSTSLCPLCSRIFPFGFFCLFLSNKQAKEIRTNHNGAYVRQRQGHERPSAALQAQAPKLASGKAAGGRGTHYEARKEGTNTIPGEQLPLAIARAPRRCSVGGLSASWRDRPFPCCAGILFVYFLARSFLWYLFWAGDKGLDFTGSHPGGRLMPADCHVFCVPSNRCVKRFCMKL